jgi:HD superfamily phosphohydrolase
MDGFHFRRLTDPVHGTFGISELESDVLSTPAFQRLHNVKQLGLAHLVYPGAGYSRFSHSVGACHVAGRMMRAINQNCKREWDDHAVQLYVLQLSYMMSVTIHSLTPLSTYCKTTTKQRHI